MRKPKITALTIDSRTQLQILCQALFTVLFIALVLQLMGCSRRYDDLPAYWPLKFEDRENHSVGRFKTSYLAEQIDQYYRGSNPGPLGVTTFVNIDDLYNTSTFGRMLSEQLMSELTMRGFDVVELRHSDALQFLDTTGEFALSRDVGAVRKERELGGIVVGTYVTSPERVYLNARLLDPQSSMVLSAGSVEMSKTAEIAKLVRGGGAATTLERIPVRHLSFETYPLNIYASPHARAYDQEESAARPIARLPERSLHQPEFGQLNDFVVGKGAVKE